MNQCMGSGHGLFRVIEVHAEGELSIPFACINDITVLICVNPSGLPRGRCFCFNIYCYYAETLIVILSDDSSPNSHLRASCKETVTLIFLCVLHFAIAACLLSAHFACPVTRARLCVSCVSVNYSIFQHELDLRGVHQYDILVILLFCSVVFVDVLDDNIHC